MSLKKSKPRFNQQKTRFNSDEKNFNGITRDFMLPRFNHNQLKKSGFNSVNICQA